MQTNSAATSESAAARLVSFRFPRETFFSLMICAVLWQIASMLSPTLGIPPFAIPSLTNIGYSFTNVSFVDIVVTLMRVIAALIFSFVAGIVIAIAMYTSSTVDRYLSPIARLLMAVPVVSWILFAVLWFRGVEFRIVFVLIMVCAPLFTVDLLDSMRDTSRDLRKMMRSFRPTTWQYFSKLIVPAIMPGIFTSWKINLSLAIRVVTMAELVGATTGIGHQLSVAQELFSVADVFAWTLTLVILLFILEGCIGFIEGKVLRWRP
jgi:ABC-type nitrate/sulfonate/bicarbonate transport system permease component